MSKTIAQEWEHYKGLVYPFPISKEQADETRQAFMAGAMVAMVKLNELGEIEDEKKGAAELNKLMSDITQENLKRVEQLKSRN